MKLKVIVPLLLVFVLTACTPEYFITLAFEHRGATPAQVEQAIKVANCESSLQHWVISPGGGNWGLFQINTVHRQRVERLGYTWDDMLLPLQNAVVAADIWAEQGWRPWSCRKVL